MKDLKISKELASAVLGKEVTKCSLINKARNSINITYFEDKEDFNPICKEWNIYEFAFKCKEWAYTKCNYTLDSTLNPFGGFCSIDIYEIDIGKTYNTPNSIYEGANEAEAIIKACYWILEDKEQNGL